METSDERLLVFPAASYARTLYVYRVPARADVSVHVNEPVRATSEPFPPLVER